MSLARTGALLSATALLLVGCAEFSAPGVMSSARDTSPSGGAYPQALYRDYMVNAEYEFEEMEDAPDAIFHATKAVSGAQGQSLQPQAISERDLPPEHVGELTEARTRLVAALGAGGAQEKPDAAALGLASFDCWMEQQEENFQPGDIAACKEHFYAALAELETRAPEPAPVPLPEVISLSSDVLFDFDKSAIKDAFRPELRKIADLINDNPTVPVAVFGHTDSIGTDQYNQGLSMERANAVADFLRDEGVEPSRLRIEGYGETQPVASNETPAGRQQNRRVDIVTVAVEG